MAVAEFAESRLLIRRLQDNVILVAWLYSQMNWLAMLSRVHAMRWMKHQTWGRRPSAGLPGI